jgi:hypothetical protein
MYAIVIKPPVNLIGFPLNDSKPWYHSKVKQNLAKCCKLAIMFIRKIVKKAASAAWSEIQRGKTA